jgi:hypothetical protein
MILRLIRASQHIAYVIYRSTIQIDRGPCEPHCIKVMLVFPALGVRHSPAVDEILYS